MCLSVLGRVKFQQKGLLGISNPSGSEVVPGVKCESSGH